MTKESCASRMKRAMEINGMKQVELCEKTNIPKSAMSQYVNGSFEPKQDRVWSIAKALNVSEAWLMGYDVPMERDPTATKSIFDYDNILPLPKTRKIPLIGNIACGTPILAEENIEQYIDMDEGVHADYCLRCKGDSMINARIHDGDIVFVRQQDDVENGQIAVVLIDNEATLKRVYKQVGGLLLQPENPTFQPLFISDSELDNVRIQGRAVAFTSTVR